MEHFKKYAAPLSAFALIVVAAAGVTFVHQTQAQGTTNTIKTARAHMMGQGVGGTVASISGNTITLTGKNGTTYAVDASSAQISKTAAGTKTTISVSSISVGDSLRVLGTVSGTNVTAKTIIDGTFPVRQPPAATGTISAINGNTLTLTSNGTTYTIDASKAVLMVTKPAGTSLANSGITVGDSISVAGTVTGTNIVATRISDGKPGTGKGVGFMPMMGK